MLENRRKRIDWLTLILYFNIVAIGLLTIYSSAQGSTDGEVRIDFSTPIGRQLIWLGVALVGMLFVLTVSAELWKSLHLPVYLISLAGLVAVLVFGSQVKGQQAWFNFGPVSFQPAELAKLGTLLFLSGYLANFRTDLKEWRSTLTALAIVLVPVGLILLQPDAGSALVFSAMLLPMYRAGLSGTYFLSGFLFVAAFLASFVLDIEIILLSILMLGLIFFLLQLHPRRIWGPVAMILVALSVLGYLEGLLWLTILVMGVFVLLFGGLLWRQGDRALVLGSTGVLGLAALLAISASYLFQNVLLPHQRARIDVWLNPSNSDPHGPLYNVLQSKLAIASGGLEGKGFMEGTITRLQYVPEQTTDFIFCIIGEEQGFLGAFGVILLFTLLVLRILQIAERQRTEFSCYYAYGIAGILFLHFVINIGMTIGLMPVIGIPLPFISYGGSSLLFFTILISILVKLDYTDRIR
jgi:rod shape determining protein RodA